MLWNVLWFSCIFLINLKSFATYGCCHPCIMKYNEDILEFKCHGQWWHLIDTYGFVINLTLNRKWYPPYSGHV